MLTVDIYYLTLQWIRNLIKVYLDVSSSRYLTRRQWSSWPKLWSHLKALPEIYRRGFSKLFHLVVDWIQIVVSWWSEGFSSLLYALSRFTLFFWFCLRNVSTVQLLTLQLVSLKGRASWGNEREGARGKLRYSWNVVLEVITHQYFHIFFIKCESL